MDELERLFDALDDEETEGAVTVELGRAIPRTVAGALDAFEQVEDALAGHDDVPFAPQTVELARQASVGTVGGYGTEHTDVIDQTAQTRAVAVAFVRQVGRAQSQVAQSGGLRGAVSSLNLRAGMRASAVDGALDWSGVPLGVDRAMERDARRYDGGF